jgi:hypothetical protein
MILSRKMARFDLGDDGVRVGRDGDRVYPVRRVPLDPIETVRSWIVSWTEWSVAFEGTCPLAAMEDCSDPDALAALVTRYHDYPDADALGGMIAD